MGLQTCCTASWNNQSPGHIDIFSRSKLAPGLLERVSHLVYSGLKCLLGAPPESRFHIYMQPFGCVPYIVIDEYYIVPIPSEGR